jgi:hypothetical protein
MNAIETDLQFLCGELEDRQPQTDEEKRAAQYVTDRFAASLDNAHRVDFDAIGNYRLMFAAYCGEFAFISLVAMWWPTVAFFYGLAIFLAYMAEFMGYPIFSRFLPHYESSSAVGLSDAHDASCFLVFTAYLDTDDNPFSRVEAKLTQYCLHYLVILCMVFVLATCGIDALGSFTSQVNPHTWWMRWAGAGVFLLLSVAGFLRSLAVRQNRGANNNASGVTALLCIADQMRANPIKNTTVLFYAAGSHHAGMEGMRTMLKENPGMADNTYLINIDGVGAGQLCYTCAEGILHRIPCAPELVAIAEHHGENYQATAARLHNRRTNAYLPLMGGIPSISIVALQKDGLPAHFGSDTDVLDNVDVDAIASAAAFAEFIGREAASRHLAIEGFNDNA